MEIGGHSVAHKFNQLDKRYFLAHHQASSTKQKKKFKEHKFLWFLKFFSWCLHWGKHSTNDQVWMWMKEASAAFLIESLLMPIISVANLMFSGSRKNFKHLFISSFSVRLLFFSTTTARTSSSSSRWLWDMCVMGKLLLHGSRFLSSRSGS